MLLHPDKDISGTKGWAWPHILARRYFVCWDPGPPPPCSISAMMRADPCFTHTNEPQSLCPGHRLDCCFMEAAVTRLQSPQGHQHQRKAMESKLSRKDANERQQSLLASFLSFGSHSWAKREPQRCTGLYHGPSWKELEDSTCLCGHANSGRVTPLRGLTWGPGVIPVMSAEAIELHVSKGHRMGSEPFQFTDAPFHL